MILTEEEVAEIRAHHANGAKQARLAQAYGVTPHTIRQITHNPNYRPRWRIQWTTQHRQHHREIKVAQRNVGINTKITPADVQDIKRRLANGERGSKIAEMYGISESTISLIRKGKRWGDVEVTP